MLFDYSLEGQTASTTTPSSFLQLIESHKISFLFVVIAIGIAAVGHPLVAVVFAAVALLCRAAYKLWIDIASIRYTTDLSDFTLQDVINDLEYR